MSAQLAMTMNEGTEQVQVFKRGDFQPNLHFYPRVLNAQIHPLVRFFLSLEREQIVERYVHLHPKVDRDNLNALLSERPKFLRWAGTDLMNVTDADGNRTMTVIETNSCPSGQKSMPLIEEYDELGGYRALIEQTFLPLLRRRRLPKGALAVVYDKNQIEASGYAAALAEVSGEPVYLVPFLDADKRERGASPLCRFQKPDGLLEVFVQNEWVPIRAAFRYVTQRPWNRLPLKTSTAILNPVLGCLAGGRNKTIAARAYEMFNALQHGTGLHLNTPATFQNVSLREVPLFVERLGGHAVVKNPYSNAGQGVYTITNEAELDAFLAVDHRYDRFLVQSLIGNINWSSRLDDRVLYHVGTLPNKRNETFVNDLRFMLAWTQRGLRPIAIYARRAQRPLPQQLGPEQNSWEILGTNLSVKTQSGWSSATDRLMLVDRKDFNALGLGIDDLIEAYIQSALAMIAIDHMARRLVGQKGQFKRKLFASLTDDQSLMREIDEGNA